MKKFLIPILAAVLCGLLLAAVLTLPGSETPADPTPIQNPSSSADAPSQESGSSDADNTHEETTPVAAALAFPLDLENNQLNLNPPFSYDGLNPDCGNAEGKNIAAITVKNISDQHLVLAELTLIADDGTEIPFRIEHLPSDKQVTAFALDNTSLPTDAAWVEVRITTEYAQQQNLRGNGVDITESGMLIDVRNSTDAELTNLKIYCHNLLGEEYFGGKSYPYEINNLPAGETVTVEALDCILGIAEAAYTVGN